MNASPPSNSREKTKRMEDNTKHSSKEIHPTKPTTEIKTTNNTQ
jgi:hypothetical protein